MRSRRWLTGLVVAAFVMLMAGTAASTIVQFMSLEEISAAATLVVVGDVERVEASWNDQQTKIYTRITIRPEETLKGTAGLETVTIKLIGGKVGEVDARMCGTPSFSEGERVLVFLEPREDRDGHHLVGLYQGKYEVVGDPADGDEILQQFTPCHHVKVVERSGRQGESETLTLDVVRQLLKGGAR